MSKGNRAGGAAPFPRELREKLPARDPEAIACFFDAYFDRVYGYLRRLVQADLGRGDRAEDLELLGQGHEGVRRVDGAVERRRRAQVDLLVLLAPDRVERYQRNVYSTPR